jgi:hypothetical protein
MMLLLLPLPPPPPPQTVFTIEGSKNWNLTRI